MATLSRTQFTPDQVARFEARRRMEMGLSPVATSQPKKQSKGFLSSLIQEGGGIGGAAAGAAAGSVLGPIGTLVGAGIGGFGGSLFGGLAESKVRDDKYDLGSNLKEATLDGILSAGPLKLLKGASTATKAAKGGATLAQALRAGGDDAAKFTLRSGAGKKVTQAGENLVAKQFRLNPTQQFNFINKHKVEPTKVISSLGINSSDDIGKLLPQYYDEFKNIAKAVPEFKTSDVTLALKKTYTPLLDSVIPTNKQLGNQLKSISDDITQKYADNMPSDVVNAIRQEADGAVRYTLRGTADEGANRQTASVLRKLMQNAADKNGLKSVDGLTFKDVGKKISQLEDLAEITGRQEFLGTGSLPLNLPVLIGGVAGGAAFGPAGLGTAGAVAAVNSPLGRRMITKGTQKLGETLTNSASKAATTKGIATNAARNLTLSGALGAGAGGLQSLDANSAIIPNANPNNIAPNNASIDATTLPQQQQEVNPTASLFAPENLQNNVTQILAGGGTMKDVEEYLGVAETMQALSGTTTPEEKPLGTEAQKRALTSQSGLRSLQTLEETLANDSGAFKRQALPNPFGITAGLTGTTDVRAATDNVVDVIARLRSGAAITEAEAARFARLLPQPGDSVESAARKIANVRAELESFMQPATNSGLEEALLAYSRQ